MPNTKTTGFSGSVEALSLTASDVNLLTTASLTATSVDRKDQQQLKRDSLFVRLSFLHIRQMVPDPTSRVVLIAKAFIDMEHSNECVLGRKIWECAGVRTPHQRRRVLARLRKSSPNLQIKDRTGRPSILIFS